MITFVDCDVVAIAVKKITVCAARKEILIS